MSSAFFYNYECPRVILDVQYSKMSFRCRQVPLSRTWFPPTQGADYKFGQTQKPDNVPPVIIALDAADPRRKPKEDPQYK